jgi:NitT/TauT family transport system substrate-binding protein
MDLLKMMATFALASVIAMSPGASSAADKINVVSAQRGYWDPTLIEFGVRKGIYAAEGLTFDTQWTDGGSDTLQSVIVGTMDIGYDTGIQGVLSARERGAPLIIISAVFAGASDYAWFVRKDSPIRSVDDLDGKQIAFSRPGASSHQVIQHMLAVKGKKARLVSTGGAPATLTAVMSGQIDVGYTVPPGYPPLIAKGDIRVIFTGQDVPGVVDQTVRVTVANANWLAKNQEVARRWVRAQRKTLEWAYSSDEALNVWAEMQKITLEQARSARDSSYPIQAMRTDSIGGLDLTIEQSIEAKRLSKPLTEAQKADLVKWIAELHK